MHPLLPKRLGEHGLATFYRFFYKQYLHYNNFLLISYNARYFYNIFLCATFLLLFFKYAFSIFWLHTFAYIA